MAGAFNFIVTIINMRAPGMTLMRMPVFVWMTLSRQFLIVLAFPAITVGAGLPDCSTASSARTSSTSAAGGDPILWQHLFWIFGHPEVYILILPAMGIVSEVLPTFSRKPLFGYAVVVFSGIADRLPRLRRVEPPHVRDRPGPGRRRRLRARDDADRDPDRREDLQLARHDLGRARSSLTTAMLFAVGFIALFIIGGLSGVMHASPPVDLQQTDTYFVVAHIHYVLFGGTILGLFAGIYYWFPKMTGRLLDERLGKLHFWLMFVGFNLTFFPHALPRRSSGCRAASTPTRRDGLGLLEPRLDDRRLRIALGDRCSSSSTSSGALRRGAAAPADPWDGATLEWATSSPPPEHNFDTIPPVYGRDPFWREKHGDSRGRKPAPLPAVAGSARHPHAVAVVLADRGRGRDRPRRRRCADPPGASSWPASSLLVVGAWAFELEHHRNPAHATPDGRARLDHRKLAMWVFLGSECLFFGTLIATYLVYKGRSVIGPHPHEILNIPLTSLRTFVLLMCRLLMVLALAAVQRGDRRQARLWLCGTAFFGADLPRLPGLRVHRVRPRGLSCSRTCSAPPSSC